MRRSAASSKTSAQGREASSGSDSASPLSPDPSAPRANEQEEDEHDREMEPAPPHLAKAITARWFAADLGNSTAATAVLDEVRASSTAVWQRASRETCLEEDPDLQQMTRAREIAELLQHASHFCSACLKAQQPHLPSCFFFFPSSLFHEVSNVPAFAIVQIAALCSSSNLTCLFYLCCPRKHRSRLRMQVRRLNLTVEILVNAAGVCRVGRVENCADEDLNAQMMLNVVGTSRLTQLFARGITAC